MIPKVVYQTWVTKSLPKKVEEDRQRMMAENPEYKFILFDDAEMDAWMRTHMDKETNEAYDSLAVGAAKADLWRYCILYKEGGIYLDIDSTIVRPLHNLIKPTDQAILSREWNPRQFVQYCMIFKKGHSILEYTIKVVVQNIFQKTSTNVSKLTGPLAFSFAVNMCMAAKYTEYIELYDESDDNLNAVLTHGDGDSCRFFGFNYRDPYTGEYYANWKSECADDLYVDIPHWLTYSNPFKEK